MLSVFFFFFPNLSLVALPYKNIAPRKAAGPHAASAAVEGLLVLKAVDHCSVCYWHCMPGKEHTVRKPLRSSLFSIPFNSGDVFRVQSVYNQTPGGSANFFCCVQAKFILSVLCVVPSEAPSGCSYSYLLTVSNLQNAVKVMICQCLAVRLKKLAASSEFLRASDHTWEALEEATWQERRPSHPSRVSPGQPGC